MMRWSRGWRFALLLGAYLLGVGVASPVSIYYITGVPYVGLLEIVMSVAVFGSLAAIALVSLGEFAPMLWLMIGLLVSLVALLIAAADRALVVHEAEDTEP